MIGFILFYTLACLIAIAKGSIVDTCREFEWLRSEENTLRKALAKETVEMMDDQLLLVELQRCSISGHEQFANQLIESVARREESKKRLKDELGFIQSRIKEVFPKCIQDLKETIRECEIRINDVRFRAKTCVKNFGVVLRELNRNVRNLKNMKSALYEYTVYQASLTV
jgi:hypothetical protein